MLLITVKIKNLFITSEHQLLMITSIEDFYAQSQKYVEWFNSFSQKHTLGGIAKADHICYKCNSRPSFEAMRALFEQNSDYIYQSIISKRRICIVKLKEGIKTVLGTIYLLELSDQKPDGSQVNTFDHIEVYGVTISYDQMVNKLAQSEKIIKVERPHHTTHDVEIKDNFLFRCTQGPLIEKIKHEEIK